MYNLRNLLKNFVYKVPYLFDGLEKINNARVPYFAQNFSTNLFCYGIRSRKRDHSEIFWCGGKFFSYRRTMWICKVSTSTLKLVKYLRIKVRVKVKRILETCVCRSYRWAFELLSFNQVHGKDRCPITYEDGG